MVSSFHPKQKSHDILQTIKFVIITPFSSHLEQNKDNSQEQALSPGSVWIPTTQNYSHLETVFVQY